MNKNKNLTIAVLCTILCVMAIGYAAFATTLKINGTASIDSKWEVAITNIVCSQKAVTGGEALDTLSSDSYSHTGTTASFTFKFKQPGDTGECTVTIKNSGTLDAKVKDIQITGNDTEGAIRYSLSGINIGDTLNKEGEDTYVVKSEYEKTVTSDPTSAEKEKELTVTIIYEQKLSA